MSIRNPAVAGESPSNLPARMRMVISGTSTALLCRSNPCHLLRIQPATPQLDAIRWFNSFPKTGKVRRSITASTAHDSLNFAKCRATVPRDSNRETSHTSTKRGKGVSPGLSWFGTFSWYWVFIQRQTLEIKSPNSGIRTLCNIQRLAQIAKNFKNAITEVLTNTQQMEQSKTDDSSQNRPAFRPLVSHSCLRFSAHPSTIPPAERGLPRAPRQASFHDQQPRGDFRLHQPPGHRRSRRVLPGRKLLLPHRSY